MTATTVEDKPQPAGAAGDNRLRLLLQILPKVPLVAKVLVWHLLRLSSESKHQDLRTELLVKVLQAFLKPGREPRTISATQKLFSRDPGIKGRIWISKYTAPVPPETTVLESLQKAIDGLQEPISAAAPLTLPEIAPVEAEWTAYREDATEESTLPPVSQKELYAELMKDVKNPTTVLYCHGGGYYLMDPATHRAATKKLAKVIGGRCYSIRYRLAPQHPFPAALLDALVSYLTLLYPPPDAFHEAVQPQHLVLAGDSAGGNLATVLLLTLLELRRQNIKITWYGQERDLPLPAAVTVNSPWLDITHSSPSCETMLGYDYLPGRSILDITGVPACDAWPAKPPRATLYAADAFVAHPLVAPVLAPTWKGAPPLYVCTGWELLADEGKFLATQFLASGVPVVHEEYEGMPHCFGMISPNQPAGQRCFAGWGGFIKAVMENPGTVETKFTVIKAKTLKEVPADPASVKPYTREEIGASIRKWIAEREGGTSPAGVSAKL